MTTEINRADTNLDGPADAGVTLVLYGDYECKDSRAACPILMRLRERFGDDFRSVFQHFPRREEHPHAEQAALVAEAAAEQRCFWEANDQLYTHPGQINEAAIAGIGETTGLTNIPSVGTSEVRYEHGHSYDRRNHDQMEVGGRSGGTDTPTFFINGRRHHGSYDEQTLQRAIEAAR